MRPTTPCPRPMMERAADCNPLQASSEGASIRAINERAQADLRTLQAAAPNQRRIEVSNSMPSMPPRASHKMTLQHAEHQLAAAATECRDRASDCGTPSKAKVARRFNLSCWNRRREERQRYRSPKRRISQLQAARRNAPKRCGIRLGSILSYTTIRAPISGQVTRD